MTYSRIAELRAVNVDRSRTVDFTQLSLQIRKSHAVLFDLLLGQGLHGLLEDLARASHTEELRGLGEVEIEDLMGC
jgi:hypothetical protein